MNGETPTTLIRGAYGRWALADDLGYIEADADDFLEVIQ